MAVTGYGRAEKAQVQKMVQAVLGLSALGRRGRRAGDRDLPRAQRPRSASGGDGVSSARPALTA
jgi:hypothetical protein